MDRKTLYSIIIPCYRSSETVGTVVVEAAAAMASMGRDNLEIILVNDASPDEGKTWAKLKELAETLPYTKAIDLAKNVGQHNALMAGLRQAKGDVIISLDDDGQTDPSQLPVLFEKMEEGYDIVYGYYPKKKESLFRRFGSAMNHLSFKIFTGKPGWLHTSSFWIIKKYVRDSVIQYTGIYTHMQGLFLRATASVTCVPVVQRERLAGKSGYSLRKLVGLWSNMLGFSVVPLRIAADLGGVFSAVGILGAVVVIIRKLIHPEMAIGWASTMAAICFFSGVILLFMGLIGEYVGRLYIGQNAAPQYVIREVCGEEDEPRAQNSLRTQTRNSEPTIYKWR